MNIRPNPTVAVLAGLMKWIATGTDGRPEFVAGSLEFTWGNVYEVDGRIRKIIYIFKQGALLGRLIPVYEEDTDKLVKWLIQRDTALGVFIEEVDGTYDYMADYAVNMFLIDPEVIKREFEERAKLRASSGKLPNGDLPGQVRETTESVTSSKPAVYEVEMEDFIEVVRAPMGKDISELGKVFGVYKVTDVKTLQDLYFECTIVGDECINWINCTVLSHRDTRFPRYIGNFRMKNDWAIIESRFFKGTVAAGIESNQLAGVIETYLVKPHANHSAK